MSVEKLNMHYSMTNPASVYDEEALTALELAGRTAHKVNECVEEVNQIPTKISEDVQSHISDGSFDRQIENHTAKLTKELQNTHESFENTVGEFSKEIDTAQAEHLRDYNFLNSRIDNLARLAEGSTTGDAELIDARLGSDGLTYPNLGDLLRTLLLPIPREPIVASNYMEKLPSANINKAGVYKLVFLEGSSDIPSDLPITNWVGTFGLLFSTSSNLHNNMSYVAQIFINEEHIYFRWSSTDFSKSVWHRVGSESATWSNKTIMKNSYADVMPTINNLSRPSVYRFLFEEGSTEIPEGFPWSAWEGSTATLITTPQNIGANADEPYYCTQILFTTVGLYYRIAGREYQPWVNLTGQTSDGVSSHTITEGQSILEGLKHCYDKGIKRLVVGAGYYDVLEEYKKHYGADYFDNYAGYATNDPFDRGLWLNDIEIVFNAGAKVVAHYNGTNELVKTNFSPFSTGVNVTIDGLVLDSSKLRYGIHADYSRGVNRDNFIMRNCDLRHFSSENNIQTIGAGFGLHSDWLIENCIFRGGYNSHVVRIHNNKSETCQSRAVFRNCYIDGAGYFLFNHYSGSEKESTIIVCGCSFMTAPKVGFETSDSTIENMKLLSFNNELRGV